MRAVLLFAAGNGDVGGSLLAWRRGKSDERIAAEAYSSQVFQVAAESGMRVWALPNRPGPRVRSGQIAVVPCVKKCRSGVRYYIEEVRYGALLGQTARRVDAGTMLIATSLHPLGYAAACVAFRRPVVVSRHTGFWTRGERRPSGIRWVVMKVGIVLLMRWCCRVICVSEEVAKQFRKLYAKGVDRTVVHVPQYDSKWSASIGTGCRGPGRVLYAGRVEVEKGVIDVVEAARIVESVRPRGVVWVIAGDGSAMKAVQQKVADYGLDEVVKLAGYLERDELIAEIKGCRMTVTPTRSSCSEGLAKLPIEGGLFCKPAIVSSAVPAADLLGKGAEVVAPGDPGAIASAVLRLLDDRELYNLRASEARKIRDVACNPALSFQSVVRAALCEAGTAL